MHPDRSCPPLHRALCATDPLRLLAGPRQTAPPEASCEARVVGLGAPLSVRIRVRSCEIPLLRAQVIRSLEQARPPLHAADDERPATGGGSVRVWEEMLDQLADLQVSDACLEVLWPTAYASPVLRAALDDALDAVAHAATQNRDLDSLAAVLLAAHAALDTLRAFVAVDFGGLDEVAL